MQRSSVTKVMESTTPIRKLVTQLMAEPFAESQHLGEATLDQLGRALEEAASDYERTDLPPSLQDAAGSFQRCKDLYCQILLDLESLRVGDWEQKTLAELAEEQTLAASTPVPPIAPDEVPTELPDMPFDEPSIPLDLPAMELPSMPQGDMFMAESPTQMVEENPESLVEVPESIPVMAPQIPHATILTAELELERQEVTSPLEEEVSEPTLVTDLNVLKAEVAKAAPEPLPMKAVETTPAFTMPKSVKTDLGFGQKAKELQLISEWLRGLAPKEPSSLDSPQINRMATQLLGAAMELECWDRMREGTQKVWDKRESAIKRIFDAKKSPGGLPQATKDQLAQLEKTLVKGSDGKPLPYFAMENSLRYLMTLPKFEHFRLSLLDAGTYLFFFGQKRELREYQLENHFWTQEGKSAETAEAALRLIRFHEQHKRSLTPWSEGEVAWPAPEQAEESAKKILSLFDTVGLRRGR